MIDWSQRIDELAVCLSREYRMEDRAALEILLSALVPCPRTANLWIVLETNFYGRNCNPGWFSLGETWSPVSLSQIRTRHPWREIEAMVKELLDTEEEHLFIEPDFERYPMFSRISNSLFVLDRSLRLRAVTPRTPGDHLMVVDQREQERITDQVNAYTRAVILDPAESRPADPPKFHEPAHFAYTIELVERLSPWFRDWTTLARNFPLLAVRHAWLYGRSETGPEDLALLARMAHDSIPPWIETAIRILLEGPGTPARLEKAMGLEEKTRRSGHGAHRELIRLRRRGLIQWNQQKFHWRLREEHRQGLSQLIEGTAFGPQAQAA